MQGTYKFLVKGLVAALVASAPAATLKAEEGFRWGLMGSLASPMGDLSKKEGANAGMGFGLTALGEYGFNDKMALRGRIGYTMFGGNSAGAKSTYYVEYTPGIYNVSADLVYSFDSLETGFYVLGGLGYMSSELNFEVWAGGQKLGNVSVDNASGLGFSAGLGFNFTKNMGAELKYNSSLGWKNEDKGHFDWNWIEASFIYRF
jgi:opacity protein-like surface antigen